eukprot:TRINITY_DN10601_c0_g1_i1.p1 TRINITY_DN10601_c0_g1~~TRINITY_DN10601_c0_g1_i1.p1  ORF type:complete len:324 (+),score=80.92 TRINITY_DN10601_c0_g1_i1:29-973(+)
MAEVESLLAEKQKELADLEQKITKVTGRNPNERRQRRPSDRRDDSRRRDYNSANRVPIVGRRGRDDDLEELEELPERDGRMRSIVASKPESAKRPASHDDNHAQPAPVLKKVASATVVTSRPARPASGDKKSSARNKRMFGMLMGTLQRASRTAEKPSQSQKRMSEVEEKLARQNEEEREEYRQERSALFQERWEKQNELFKLEQQVELPTWQVVWEQNAQQCNKAAIKLKADPPVFFIPAKHNDQTRAMLVESQRLQTQQLEERKEHWQPKDLKRRVRKEQQQTDTNMDDNEDKPDKPDKESLDREMDDRKDD